MRGLVLIVMIFVSYFSPYQLLNAQLTIGEWRTHLPYSQAIYVTEAGDRIFCATRSGLFYYNKEDNTLNKFTRIIQFITRVTVWNRQCLNRDPAFLLQGLPYY